MTPTSHDGATSVRPSIVIVSPWLYHPRCGNGGGVICFNVLKRLASHYDVHFVCFDQTSNDSAGGRKALEAYCASVSTVPLPEPIGKVWGWVQQVLTGQPREARALKSAPMSTTIKALAERLQPSLILLQFPQAAQYMQAAGSVPVVMDVQDACTVSRYREWRKTSSPLKRLAKFLTWIAWARYEHHWYSRASTLLAISENDHGVLSSFLPEVSCFYSPVAVEVEPHRARLPGAYVAFIGNFSHAPNRDALQWLLQDIWPLVRARIPSAVLRVAGPHLPDHVRGDARQGIEVVGFVDDLDDFYANASMALVPYRFGGGVKIKTLEAMAHACPVVATTVGAEGLRVEHGRHLLVADEPVAFATAICALLTSAETGALLGEAARRHVEHDFSWDAKMAGMRRVFAQVGRPAVNGS